MSRAHPKWVKYVLPEEGGELAEVVRLDEEITALMVKIRKLKATRKSLPVIARCNLRGWRANRKRR